MSTLIDARRAQGDQVPVEHHESKRTMSYQRILIKEGDAPLLPLLEATIARDRGVVLVDSAIAQRRAVEVSQGKLEPSHQAQAGISGAGRPVGDKLTTMSRVSCGTEVTASFPKLFF